MRRVLLLEMAMVLAIANGGCATVINMQEETRQKPYGGFLMKPADFFGGDQPGETSAKLFWPMWLADKPLSLVGDTVTLPYTIWAQRDTSLAPKEECAGAGQTP